MVMLFMGFVIQIGDVEDIGQIVERVVEEIFIVDISMSYYVGRYSYCGGEEGEKYNELYFGDGYMEIIE